MTLLSYCLFSHFRLFVLTHSCNLDYIFNPISTDIFYHVTFGDMEDSHVHLTYPQSCTFNFPFYKIDKNTCLLEVTVQQVIFRQVVEYPCVKAKEGGACFFYFLISWSWETGVKLSPNMIMENEYFLSVAPRPLLPSRQNRICFVSGISKYSQKAPTASKSTKRNKNHPLAR